MSAAGFDRVKVTHRKLFSVRAAKSLSFTTTTSGKPSSGPAREFSRQRCSILSSTPDGELFSESAR